MFSIDYNLFSILILAVLIMYNYFIESKNKISILFFQRIILLNLIMCLAESISVILKSLNYQNLFFQYLVTTVFFISFTMLPFQFLAYVILNIKDKDVYDKYKNYLIIPVIIVISLILINPFNDFIFSFSYENGYQLNCGWYVVIITALSYSLLIGILIIIGWKWITITLRLSVLLYVLLSSLSYLILIFVDRELMILGVTIVLCLIIMQLNLQNPQMINEAIEHEQEEKLEAIRANREKSNFLANMSHEIRTPLNVITSMNEMILRESKNEQIEDYAERIKTSGEILISIINNVFDISKIEVGRVEILENEYELADLLKELTAIGTVRAEDKHLLFLTEVDSKLPRVLYGDSQHLRQIVMNLIVNATKYTNRGSITFKVGYNFIDENNIRIILSVSDTGIGICEDQQANIFDAFSRGGIEKTTNIEGTGLGLAIAKRFTELMNGTIEVTSVKGMGSTFTIKIPQKIISSEYIGNFELQRADYVKERHMNQHTFIAPEAKVLIVDDNKMNRMAIQCLLKRTEIQIDLAENGRQALEKVSQNSYHIIFLDHMMPELNGIETLHIMKDMNLNKSKHAPIIALTANAVGGARQTFLKEGFDGYLAKPVLWEELESMIVSLLPKELVIQREVKQLITAQETQQIEQYAKALYEADISLTEGLYYVNGDLEQYKKQATLFVNLYESSKTELELIYQMGDMKRIGTKIHALKGNAKSIGAVDLYYTARRMEQRCNRNDQLYISTIMPHLLMEWERAKDGLGDFIQNISIGETYEKKKYNNQEIFALLEQLSECIYNCKAVEGIYLVKELLTYSLPEKLKDELEKINSLLEEIEYSDADIVLKGVLSEYKNENFGN